MEIYLMTWPEVEEYLKSKKTILIPVGSTEQHGPSGIIGTDFLTAWEIAKKVGDSTQTLVASPLCYGMALHHMSFAGSASLKPSTFILMVKEVIESYARHGFENFYFINGHGGNIAPLTSAFSEALGVDKKYNLKVFNWWHLAEVREYEEKHFGEQNGFHATCGEISVTMATHPQAFKIKRSWEYFPTPEKYSWPQSADQFRKTFPDGRMGSNPQLANDIHGQALFEIASKSIADSIGK